MGLQALERFLYQRFLSRDAGLLMYFFEHYSGRDFFLDRDLDILDAEKKDLILLGYEERLFLPVKTKAGPAWEDRILDFHPASQYGVPMVVQRIPEVFQTSRGFSLHGLVETLVPPLFSGHGDRVAALLEILTANCSGSCFEAGLLKLFYERFQFAVDLHDVLDFFVISGMMSPCPRKSLMTGLSFYEISPVLFWEK